MSDWHLSRSGVHAIAQARPRNGRKYAPPPRRATAAVADADMATEAFDSLGINRPSDGDAFSCSLPELKSVCVGEEECDVGETVRARLLNWLESADPEHVNWDHRGERIFRYDAPSDNVVMSYYGPEGRHARGEVAVERRVLRALRAGRMARCAFHIIPP